jgi:hypothetical protein
MNSVDETSIREQLQRAVEILDPVPPPLAELEARAAKRRRMVRLVGGFGGVALAGACAAVVVVVITAGSGDAAKVTPATAPSSQSLTNFAMANGAVRGYHNKSPVIGGPFHGQDGYYGAFTVKAGVGVATWNGSAWRVDGPTVKKFGPGQFLLKIGAGPAVNGPSLYVRGAGGDVSYFGYVLQDGASGWAPVLFGKYDSLPYGHPAPPGFVSVRNTCRPDCAAGTHIRDFWRWHATKGKFVLARSHRLS